MIQAKISRVGNVEQPLELGELGLGHGRQVRIREPAHDEIHLPHAAAQARNKIRRRRSSSAELLKVEPDMWGLSMTRREPPWCGFIQSSVWAAATGL